MSRGTPPGCAPNDAEAAARANEAYRQRSPLSQDLQASAEYHRKRITAALQRAVDVETGGGFADGACLLAIGHRCVHKQRVAQFPGES